VPTVAMKMRAAIADLLIS